MYRIRFYDFDSSSLVHTIPEGEVQDVVFTPQEIESEQPLFRTPVSATIIAKTSSWLKNNIIDMPKDNLRSRSVSKFYVTIEWEQNVKATMIILNDLLNNLIDSLTCQITCYDVTKLLEVFGDELATIGEDYYGHSLVGSLNVFRNRIIEKLGLPPQLLSLQDETDIQPDIVVNKEVWQGDFDPDEIFFSEHNHDLPEQAKNTQPPSTFTYLVKRSLRVGFRKNIGSSPEHIGDVFCPYILGVSLEVWGAKDNNFQGSPPELDRPWYFARLIIFKVRFFNLTAPVFEIDEVHHCPWAYGSPREVNGSDPTWDELEEIGIDYKPNQSFYQPSFVWNETWQVVKRRYWEVVGYAIGWGGWGTLPWQNIFKNVDVQFEQFWHTNNWGGYPALANIRPVHFIVHAGNWFTLFRVDGDSFPPQILGEMIEVNGKEYLVTQWFDDNHIAIEGYDQPYFYPDPVLEWVWHGGGIGGIVTVGHLNRGHLREGWKDIRLVQQNGRLIPSILMFTKGEHPYLELIRTFQNALNVILFALPEGGIKLISRPTQFDFPPALPTFTNNELEYLSLELGGRLPYKEVEVKGLSGDTTFMERRLRDIYNMLIARRQVRFNTRQIALLEDKSLLDEVSIRGEYFGLLASKNIDYRRSYGEVVVDVVDRATVKFTVMIGVIPITGACCLIHIDEWNVSLLAYTDSTGEATVYNIPVRTAPYNWTVWKGQHSQKFGQITISAEQGYLVNVDLSIIPVLKPIIFPHLSLDKPPKIEMIPQPETSETIVIYRTDGGEPILGESQCQWFDGLFYLPEGDIEAKTIVVESYNSGVMEAFDVSVGASYLKWLSGDKFSSGWGGLYIKIGKTFHEILDATEDIIYVDGELEEGETYYYSLPYKSLKESVSEKIKISPTHNIPPPTVRRLYDPDEKDKRIIVFEHPWDDVELYYTLDGSTPTLNDYRFREPVLIPRDTDIRLLRVKAFFEKGLVVSDETGYTIDEDTLIRTGSISSNNYKDIEFTLPQGVISGTLRIICNCLYEFKDGGDLWDMKVAFAQTIHIGVADLTLSGLNNYFGEAKRIGEQYWGRIYVHHNGAFYTQIDLYQGVWPIYILIDEMFHTYPNYVVFRVRIYNNLNHPSGEISFFPDPRLRYKLTLDITRHPYQLQQE